MPPKPLQTPALTLLSLLLVLPAAGGAGCSRAGKETNGGVEAWDLRPGEALDLPEGQIFLGALVRARVAGRWGRKSSLFCQDPQTGKIHEWYRGRIRREIRIPAGHAFAGVASWGKTVRNTEFFLRNLATGRIHTCRIRTLAGLPLRKGPPASEEPPPQPPEPPPG